MHAWNHFKPIRTRFSLAGGGAGMPPWLPILLSALAIAGCGEDLPLTPVHGKVLLNDQPLEFGSIAFQPAGGQPAQARIEPDGTFELVTRGKGEGAMVGENRVRVTCYEGQAPKPGGANGGESALGQSLIPERYTSYDTSGLTIEVQPDHAEPVVVRLTK